MAKKLRYHKNAMGLYNKNGRTGSIRLDRNSGMVWYEPVKQYNNNVCIVDVTAILTQRGMAINHKNIRILATELCDFKVK